LGDIVAEREGINTPLESVWQAKREYRAELAKKRALRFSQYLVDHKRTRDTSEAPREFKEGEYRCRSQKYLLMKYETQRHK
jgi:hypothetical protein